MYVGAKGNSNNQMLQQVQQQQMQQQQQQQILRKVRLTYNTTAVEFLKKIQISLVI
jgi:hypothetical protein